MSENGRVVLTPRDEDVPPGWYSTGGSSGSHSRQHWSAWEPSRSPAYSGGRHHDRQSDVDERAEIDRHRRIALREDDRWSRQSLWHLDIEEHRHPVLPTERSSDRTMVQSQSRLHESERVVMQLRRSGRHRSTGRRRDSRQDAQYPDGIRDDPVERIVDSDDQAQDTSKYRGRSCSYSGYSCSRSPARGMAGADGPGRSVSPVSVGSSVFGEPTSEGVAHISDRPSNGEQATTRASNPSMQNEDCAVAKQLPATQRRKVRKVKQYGTATREVANTLAPSSRPHKRRRVAKAPRGAEHLQSPGGDAAAETSRRTAAKSAASRPPQPLPATVMAAANASDADLTEPEMLELQVAVLNHLRDLVQYEEEDAEVLVEFICVLVEGKKKREEMIAELNTLDDEAENFVDWLQKTKEAILAKRKPLPNRNLPPSPAVTPAVAPTSPKAPMMVPKLDPPPGLLSAPGPAAVLTPNAVTTSLEEIAATKAAGGAVVDKSLVVITQRLVLQPNRSPGDEVDLVAGEVLSASEKKMEEANQKKMQLLAEMTQRLQVILKKLSDRNLDDATKERYQSLAQTIQSQMAALSRSQQAEKKMAMSPEVSIGTATAAEPETEAAAEAEARWGS
mmetsp:Transcript_22439/g.40489  ORF Transcript_22439/g.40489 Transcript_22439/m.40489 type:complete len:618 (-) Transcript_22439:101-1954(-)|eukprot:CAMPEP_0197642994 /NCGR_PEP_ID=MMETSP1338-20131121/16477_1 /TAXON_ID=43686 ORGANISM="Pelagodinium beii, Strain RCC1491" /NCGR_SAMPLE_ID=MMETSP1338 /ASSEMBLY_ACC=CAM_ASM_000754 /LENGTH=617 /DNA_ID=CAMNT_0043216199 /DNA_START=62 /DNA_END=1915 /DNA_ORIENTATION=+